MTPKSIQTFLVRLPLNLRSNRWFQIIGGQLFLSSSRHKKFWSERSIDPQSMLSDSFHRVYVRVPRLLKKPQSFSPKSHGFLIPHLGRFGNAVREVISAVAAATDLNMGHIYLHGDNVFAHGSDLPNPGIHTTSRGLKVWIDHPLDGRGESPDVLISWKRGVFPISENASQAAWSDAQSVLGLAPVEQYLSRDTLVIHLRGGDVFSERNVSQYGQPPLSFYLAVLNHQLWGRVVLVHQDYRNPVLENIVSECAKRALPCELVSGFLRDDVALLLRAQVLVAGRGTFVPAIAGMSAALSEVYYFEDKFLILPERNDLKIWRVKDTLGLYKKQVLTSNWSNSPAQRDLMMDYPLEHLEVQAP